MEILAGVNAKTAAAKPVPNAHSIWELLLHIAAWDGAAIRRAQGHAVQLGDAENFPPIKDTSDAAWRSDLETVKQKHDELVETVASFPESRLQEQVPGKKRPTTTSTTCSVESCSTSSTMPDKSHCSRNSSKV